MTFGEWLSYNPPPKGGKPSFSLAVPSGEAVSPSKPAKGKAKNAFVPDIPATLKSLAPSPIAGEGQWRVAESVKGEPAILTTFLRDATYTSQVNGIASIDQRLVKFSLRPGTEDPGPANWGVSDYIPAGQRKGLLATFNGGFKLDSAGGGFYLNGIYHGTLNKGVAVDRLLQERDDQDRPVGPGLHDELLDRRASGRTSCCSSTTARSRPTRTRT